MICASSNNKGFVSRVFYYLQISGHVRAVLGMASYMAAYKLAVLDVAYSLFMIKNSIQGDLELTFSWLDLKLDCSNLISPFDWRLLNA